MELRIGTCSWTDKTLIESGWYPAGVKSNPAKRLNYYAKNFNTLEVDSTFYAIPSEKVSYFWMVRTPHDFKFNVKAFSFFTMHPVKYRSLPQSVKLKMPFVNSENAILYPKDFPAEAKELLVETFKSFLKPIYKANKLGYVLFQFPPWVKASESVLNYFIRLRNKFLPYNIAVELRHSSWIGENWLKRLEEIFKEENIAYVCVDEPQLPWTIPPIIKVTSTWGMVVRFHGRNKQAWQLKNIPVAEKYRYLYSDEELLKWAEKLKPYINEVPAVYLMFNNCYKDYAVKNALRLKELLSFVLH